MCDERLHTPHSLTNAFWEGEGISHVFVHGHTQHYLVSRVACRLCKGMGRLKCMRLVMVTTCVEVARVTMFVYTSFGAYHLGVQFNQNVL